MSTTSSLSRSGNANDPETADSRTGDVHFPTANAFRDDQSPISAENELDYDKVMEYNLSGIIRRGRFSS